MKSFNPNFLKNLKLPVATTWLLGQCMEAKGKQELWLKARAETLNALKDIAIIQSAESSNRIEGVTVEKNRLRPLLEGKVKPQDRPEEEVFGYRKALDWVHKQHEKVVIEPKVFLSLHSKAQGGFSGDAGHWKAMDQLCLAYRDSIDQGTLPELLQANPILFN